MRTLAIALALVSAFFAFYTVRLLAVTHFLLATRAGGHGAYLGALVFPIVAIACAWASRRCWQRASRDRGGAA